jgi:hypothetical protein
VLHERIEKAPELPPVAEPFWLAYGYLSGSRGYSECIPVSEVKAYCEFYGIKDSWCRDFLLYFCSELNKELLDYKDVERKREESKTKVTKPSKGR